MKCLVPTLSSLEGSPEKEPRKLDTRSNVASEMDLCRHCNTKKKMKLIHTLRKLGDMINLAATHSLFLSATELALDLWFIDKNK